MKAMKTSDIREEKKPIMSKPFEIMEQRKSVLDKIQSKRQLDQQYGYPPMPCNFLHKKIIVPHSAKNSQEQRNHSKKFFLSVISNSKQKNVSSSQDKRTNIKEREEKNEKVENKEQKEPGIQKASSDYLKLHDKLSSLETKILEMKNNMQKKKQEKAKKKIQDDKIMLQKEKQRDQERQKMKEKEKQKQKEKEKEKTQRRKSTLAFNEYITQVPERKQLKIFQKNPYSPRHHIYYVSEVVRAYKDIQSLARQHIQTSLQIVGYFEKHEKPSQSKIAHKKVNLPRRKGYEDKKTVIFDLDQTLIHCNQRLDASCDVKLPIVFPNGQTIEAGINIRPYAKQILKNLSKNFQVIVFTASHSCYANVVLDHLDPQNKYIHHRLYRDHCYTTPQGMHIKDLRILNRELSNMILIDNAAYSYIYQLDNGIPILPYYHGRSDYQLKALQLYIQSMMLLQDMRSLNRRTFKLFMYRNYCHNLEKLVEELYVVQHAR